MKPSKKHQLFTADARLAVKFAAATAPASGTDAAKGKDAEWGATLTGYALVWGTLSSLRYGPDGEYKVRLAPGSATFTTPTLALYHHQTAAIIGTTANGTLRITSDDIGVKVEIDLPDTSTGRDVAELVEDGYVAGMSFSMVPGDYTETQEGSLTVRTYTTFQVDEVTVTPAPAFQDTSVALAPGSTDDDEDDEAQDDTQADDDGGYAIQLAAETIRLQRAKLAIYPEKI